jgi:hypothetical protein
MAAALLKWLIKANEQPNYMFSRLFTGAAYKHPAPDGLINRKAMNSKSSFY